MNKINYNQSELILLASNLRLIETVDEDHFGKDPHNSFFAMISPAPNNYFFMSFFTDESMGSMAVMPYAILHTHTPPQDLPSHENTHYFAIAYKGKEEVYFQYIAAIESEPSTPLLNLYEAGEIFYETYIQGENYSHGYIEGRFVATPSIFLLAHDIIMKHIMGGCYE